MASLETFHDVVATIHVAFIILYVMLVVEHSDWAWSVLLANLPSFFEVGTIGSWKVGCVIS